MKNYFFILFVAFGLQSCEKEANVEYDAKIPDKITLSGNRTTLKQNADGYYCAGPPYDCQPEVVIEMTFDQLTAVDEFVKYIITDKPKEALAVIKNNPEDFIKLFETEIILKIIHSQVYLEIKPTAKKDQEIIAFYDMRSKEMLLAYPLNIVEN